MSSQDASSSHTLDLVNSFYGPGAAACWYLTCLSCLISWTLHPKKITSDSITSDLIALATFPTVASAHLLDQVKDYTRQVPLDDWTLPQIHASMAASLIITETYIAICVILLFVTILPRPRQTKRLLLPALTGTFCFISELCLFFSIPSIRNASGIFDRSFLIDSLPTLVAALVLVSILILILLVFLYFLVKQRLPYPTADPPPEAGLEVAGQSRHRNGQHVHMLQELRMEHLTLVSVFFLPLTIAVSLIPTGRDIWQKLIQTRGVLGEFFPKTNSSITDLDQAVSLLAGMTVFGFSLYSAANERYRRWWEAERVARGIHR